MDPLRISMVGLSRWESVFVETTVDLASGIDLASWRLVNDPENADVLLVDADRRGNGAIVDNMGKNRPIVVSFSGQAGFAGRGITRPVSYAELIALLKEIESELSEPPDDNESRAVATNDTTESPPVTKVKEAARALQSEPVKSEDTLVAKGRPAKRFVEATRLIGLLKQAVEAGQPVELVHPEHPSLLVFPNYSAYSTPAESLAIPRMFRCSALDFEHRSISEKEALDALASDRCRPLSRLLYCASLFASEGRLLLNADPMDSLRLTNWPDFDAVPYLPEHKAIAKYLLVHSARLDDIAAATGIRIAVIIDFCNACEAAGLIERRSSGGALRSEDSFLEKMRSFFNT